MEALTPAQLYVLQWIHKHGRFHYVNKPSGFANLGIPSEHRRKFSEATLRRLSALSYVQAEGGTGIHATYRVTYKGEKVIEAASEVLSRREVLSRAGKL